MKIVTEFVRPPIPLRQFDWSAIDDDTYDGEGCPIGHGATEQEAINDLLAKIEPCRQKTNICDYWGECFRCNAVQGEACQAPIMEESE
jgi:hypothetical protein